MQQTLDQADQRAGDLYWLAFLLTGQHQASVGATVEALDSPQNVTSFFSNWMVAWSRKVVIAKALAAIREELAASALRTRSRSAKKLAVPPRKWVLDRNATKVQLERALLAIDALPRCAVVLAVFEGVPPEDIAILLDAEPELVKKAQIIGLRELTNNLAAMNGQSSRGIDGAFLPNEMQHA